MNKRGFSAFLVMVCAISVAAAGVVINVSPGGVDHPEGGSPENPLRTIQYALAAASPGDTILIHPGVYSGPGNYNLTPGGVDVHIRSVDPTDPAVVTSTIINPAEAGRGFTFVNGESAACILEGLTVTGGKAGKGGALLCEYSSPTIIRCAFIANTATLQGGAMFLQNSSTVVRESVIAGNASPTDGGGIESRAGNITLANCLIYGNTAATGQGGGVDIVSSPQGMIVNCTIADNHGPGGGGLYLWNSGVAVVNCILWNNTASQTQNSQIGRNVASTVVVSWSNVKGGYEGQGNIDADPLFAGTLQSAYYDYHLMSEWGRYDVAAGLWVHDAVTSPCIDAGNPATDFTAETWPHGGRANMGAFGGTGQASMNGNPADFDIDGRVDWRDLSAFAERWLTESAGIYDLDASGRVDMKDAAIFMQHWRWQR